MPLDELATTVWGDDLPASWETSLRALVSRLRAVLTRAAPGVALVSDAGCYQALLGDAWIDLEAAANAVDHAEGALRRGELDRAWSQATVAAGIGRRPLLPGEDLPWVAALQGRLRSLHVRALDVLARTYLAHGELPLAVTTARELVGLEPYREAGHRLLMRAHASAGDRAEAVRVYGALRDLLRTDLGIDPDPGTTRLFEDLIREHAPTPAVAGAPSTEAGLR